MTNRILAIREAVGLMVLVGGLFVSGSWYSYRVGVYATETSSQLQALSVQLAALQATASGAAATLQAHELRLERHEGRLERADGRLGVLEAWRDRHEGPRAHDTAAVQRAGG